MDEFDVGGDYGGYDSMNLSSSDPASAYYQSSSNGSDGSDSFGQYMPGGSSYIPEGSGAYRVGQGDWQGIYAPSGGDYWNSPASSSSGQYWNNPGQRSSGQFTDYTPVSSPRGAGDWSTRSMGGNLSGARGVAQQTPQMIQMGQPENDLYKRYKSLIMDHSQFQIDPA